MERQKFCDFQHFSPDRADDLKPVRELEQMLGDEGGNGITVIGPMDLGGAEPVDDEKASLAGCGPVAKFAHTSEAI